MEQAEITREPIPLGALEGLVEVAGGDVVEVLNLLRAFGLDEEAETLELEHEEDDDLDDDEEDEDEDEDLEAEDAWDDGEEDDDGGELVGVG